MSKYKSFSELKEHAKIFVESSKERGAFEGLRKLLTELYPDKAHFIYELLQNAEDKEASEVSFVLQKDKLIFTHDGKKRDFNLDDIDSITNIGTSTKINDPTSIGKFGVGFKAVYSYTNTPEIHSGNYDFKIVDMLVPEDEGVAKKAFTGKTQFVFPFDHDNKTPQQAVKEITEGLLALDENSILFLRNIHQIVFSLPDGKRGGIKLEDKDETLKKIIHVNALTGEKTRTYWCKFSKKCIVDSDNISKECNVDIAYKLKRIDNDEIQKYIIDSDLKGNVCIFFPAVKENSHLRFHINAPFASTVARDSVRDCSENKQLIKEIANLCVCSLYYLKDKKIIDLNLYAALPNRTDFPDVTSAYYPIYTAIINEFRNKDFIITAQGDYKKIVEVLQTNREIARLIDDTAVKMLFKKSWLPPVSPQTRELYFLQDLKIQQFDRKTIAEHLRVDPRFYDKIFEGKTVEWFRDWYVLLSEIQGVGLYKEVFKKVKMILCEDDSLHLSTDVIYIENPNFKPENIKSPIYVKLPQMHSPQNDAAKKFLEMLGVKVMSAEVDIMSDISGTNVSVDNVILTLMKVIEMKDNGENISAFKNQEIFLCHSIEDDGKIYRVKACDCCFNESVAFFYQKQPSGKYVLSEEYYDIFKTEKERQSFFGIYVELGGIVNPAIFETELFYSHPLYNQLDTSNERASSCIKIDYILTGASLLHSIPEEKLYIQSKLLWNYLNEDRHFYHHIAKYRANASRTTVEIDSSAAYYLRRIAWIPNKNGDFCRPCDITADNLYEGFVFDDNAIFLKNIGFGDPTKAPNDIAAILEKAGYKMSSIDEKFFSASEEDKQAFMKFLEAKHSKEKDTLSLEEGLGAETKEQSVYEEDDDYGRDISIKDVSKRKQKLQEEFEKSLRETPTKKQVWHYSYPSKSGQLEKQFIRDQYYGKCQICGRDAIRKYNGEQYFEAINIINTANLDDEYKNSLDTGWNTLCLCPNCAAEYRHCAKDLTGLEDQIENTQIESGRNAYIELNISLKGLKTKISFTPRHFTALQSAFRVFKNHKKD